MAKIGKRLEAVRSQLASDKDYALNEAVSILKGGATAKFDETI